MTSFKALSILTCAVNSTSPMRLISDWQLMHRIFSPPILTPDPDHFDDTNVIDLDYGDAKIMPQMGDNYLSAEIMLPRGGALLAKGRVSTHKCDWDGNPIGLANPNPISDTCTYIVDFDDGDQTELTTNMIAESFYSQCDSDGLPACPTG